MHVVLWVVGKGGSAPLLPLNSPDGDRDPPSTHCSCLQQSARLGEAGILRLKHSRGSGVGSLSQLPPHLSCSRLGSGFLGRHCSLFGPLKPFQGVYKGCWGPYLPQGPLPLESGSLPKAACRQNADP